MAENKRLDVIDEGGRYIVNGIEVDANGYPLTAKAVDPESDAPPKANQVTPASNNEDKPAKVPSGGARK